MIPRARPHLLRAVLALAAVSVVPVRAHGQSNGSVLAIANLPAPAPAVVAVQDLDFGNVTPGTPTAVNPRNAPNAGEFEISGAAGAEFTMSFALPTDLVVGPYSMPITFGPGSGCQVGAFAFFRFICAGFDPSTGVVRRIPTFGAPEVYVWLGGTVSPTPTQFPGIYRGTITLTVAYTGN